MSPRKSSLSRKIPRGGRAGSLDSAERPGHTGSVLQMSFNKLFVQSRNRHRFPRPSSLVELGEGQDGILESIELPAEARHRLMEMGFLPGSRVTAAGSAPGGNPRVFRVDGSEIALRVETAAMLKLRSSRAPDA